MVALYVLFLLWGLSSAQSPEKVGDVFPIRFRSNGISDVKGTDTPLGKTYVLNHPGATYMALHFSKLNLLTGDSIEVSDVNGDQGYTLTSGDKGQHSAFWSQHIKGDTIVLNTIASSRDRSSIFEINEYAAGFAAFFETICGLDDKANAVCYKTSFPTEYTKSKAVARLLINGNSLCTGFLVSGTDHFLTNNHCIQNATVAMNTDYEFMGEAPSCESVNTQLAFRGTIFRGATFIQTSTGLDYTVVQINSGNPAGVYGFLELDDQPVAAGGQIYIPQHAAGKAKQLAIFSTQAADASDGYCHINSVGSSGCGGSLGNNVFYMCDTEGCGGCTIGNHATSAYLIRNQLSSILPPLTAPVAVPVAAPIPIRTASVPEPIAAPVAAPIAPPVPVPTAPVPEPIAAPVAAPIAPPVPVPTAPVPEPIAAPVAAPIAPPVPVSTAPVPEPIAAPVAAPIAPPVPVPIALPTPVSAPVATPTAPSCLASGARCLSKSDCCRGVCKSNRKCN